MPLILPNGASFTGGAQPKIVKHAGNRRAPVVHVKLVVLVNLHQPDVQLLRVAKLILEIQAAEKRALAGLRSLAKNRCFDSTFRISRFADRRFSANSPTSIHREPGRSWTVGSLASEVAMSRSAFADRFTQVLGEPVMHYVARWRMYNALTILQRESADIGELATRLGYTSEAAFNRTFKRIIGMTPGVARSGQRTTRWDDAAITR